MPVGTRKSMRAVDNRVQGSLKTALHNKIQALNKAENDQYKLRDRLEAQIAHLVLEKGVSLDDALLRLLHTARPSVALLQKLFPDPKLDMSNPAAYFAWKPDAVAA